MKISRRTKLLSSLTIVIIVAGFSLWTLSLVHPEWFPAWLDTLFLIISGLGVLLSVIGSVFADLLLPLIDQSQEKINSKIQDLLRREAPIRRVDYTELIGRLGRSGKIPWIDRGLSSTNHLLQNDRIAIIGAMKSGKTREAIELIRKAQDDGIITSVYEPTSSLDLIELDNLRETVALQTERHAFLFFIDELCLRQSADDLERLSICIAAICAIRPHAHILVTLQEERLSSTLELWLKTNRFEAIHTTPLSYEQRKALVESGRNILSVQLTDDAAEVLASSEKVLKPWDIVSVLQSAPQQSTGAPALDAEQVQSLLSRTQESIWKGQRQEVISAFPSAIYLLDAIAIFMSAGVTPRENSIHRYAEFCMPKALSRWEKLQKIAHAEIRWQRFDIVAINGLYTIPEPRLLPLVIPTNAARQQIKTFINEYRPDFWTWIFMILVQPLERIGKFRWPNKARVLFRRLRPFTLRLQNWIPKIVWRALSVIQNLLLDLSSVFVWSADKALLLQELGGVGSRAAYLSSVLFIARAQGYILESKNYEAALAEINRSIALYPNNANAFCQRGIILKLMDRKQEALHALDHAISLRGNNPWYHAERGLLYRSMKEYERAIEELTLSLKYDPLNDSVIVERGYTYRLMEYFAQSITDFSQAIELNPSHRGALGQRGYVYRKMGCYRNSLTDLTKIIELAPTDPWAYGQRGLTYRRMQLYQQSSDDFNHAIELMPNDPWLLWQLGLSRQSLKRFEQSLVDFAKAIELDSTDPRYIAARGKSYLFLMQVENAISDTLKAIAIDQTFDWAFYLLGIAYLQLSNIGDANRMFAQAINIASKKELDDPRNELNRFNLALYHLSQGQIARAQKLYHNAVAQVVTIETIHIVAQELKDFVDLFPENNDIVEIYEYLNAVGQVSFV